MLIVAKSVIARLYHWNNVVLPWDNSKKKGPTSSEVAMRSRRGSRILFTTHPGISATVAGCLLSGFTQSMSGQLA